jgi:predicted dehydrogenase
LAAGKHVYCEKPVAVTLDQLKDLQAALSTDGMPVFMGGFNRRFAPLAVSLKAFFSHTIEPMMMHYRVNAGPLPFSHWLHDPVEGGGRIIGEGCHFVDLMTWLAGSLPVSASISALPNTNAYREDNVSLMLRFADGSIGSLTYLANGDRSAPKEYLEVSSAGRIAILDDFRRLECWKNGNKTTHTGGLRMDKGHAGSWQAFLAGIRSGVAPIPYAEMWAVSEITIRLVEKLRSGQTHADVELG